MHDIQTERLVMIPLTAAVIRLLLRDKTQLPQALNISVPESWPHADLTEVLPLMLGALENTPGGTAWNGMIILKDRRILVGDMGFMNGPNAEGTAEIGYATVPEYQNRGYATEMAAALIAWAFEKKGIKKIIAECLNDNAGSIRVLEKLGMRRSGQAEEMLQWALTKGEWETMH